MTTTAPVTTFPAPPEPGLTPEEMVARAAALRPLVIAEADATEKRGHHSVELHQAFLDAGFYHLYVPRRYGGYEFDVPTFSRVVREIARGDAATGWCLGLAMNHALQVASWWPESAQDAIFANGDFRGGSVSAPVGTITPTEDGWEINGQVAFASGTPHATFYMGQALRPGPGPDDEPELMMFVAPRSEWEMLDDWGDIMGLKGSGSNSIRFEHTRIPADWAIPGNMIDVDVNGGTPGSRLHGNPMYAGRAMTIFAGSLASVSVGGIFNALDEYERLMRSKKTPLPPFVPRIEDPEFQRWYGKALTRATMLEAALEGVFERHMEACRRNVEDGVDYTFGHDMLLGGIARQVIIEAFDVVNEDLFQTVGASVARDGERMARVFKDLSVAVAHRNAALRDTMYGVIGRAELGLPRVPPL